MEFSKFKHNKHSRNFQAEKFTFKILGLSPWRREPWVKSAAAGNDVVITHQVSLQNAVTFDVLEAEFADVQHWQTAHIQNTHLL